MHRSVVWQLEPSYGAEIAFVTLEAGSLTAIGTAVRAEPFPHRVSYDLRSSAPDFATTRLDVRVDGAGWHRHVTLKRAPGHGGDSPWGAWYEHGGDDPMEPVTPPDRRALGPAVDCDLSLSPIANSLPVLRHRLHEQPGQVDVVAAWVSLPDLSVRAVRQRYTHLRPGVVGFESDVHEPGELEFDGDGLATNYRGLITRIA